MGEEEDVEDEEDDEDDLANSDTDTVDSLFEDARFPKEEEEVVKEKSVKPKIDLAELVKQDLKKIVTSVEYFDEEKFEGGKRSKASIRSKGRLKRPRLMKVWRLLRSKRRQLKIHPASQQKMLPALTAPVNANPHPRRQKAAQGRK